MNASHFESVSGTDLWLLRLPVTDGGRFEYKLAIGRHGGEEWILDPLNPVRARDPFGENSECRTYGYTRPEWSESRGARAGRIEAVEVKSAAFGERREERVYLPAGYAAEQSYPLVIIHDGQDFISYADLSVSLDNLIDAGDIPPVVAALVQTRDRMGEYAHGRRHARYLVRELLPVLQSRYRISEEPEDRVVMGASLGAVASLSTAFRYPASLVDWCCSPGPSSLTSASLSTGLIRCSTASHVLCGRYDGRRRCPEPVLSSRRASSRDWPRRTTR